MTCFPGGRISFIIFTVWENSRAHGKDPLESPGNVFIHVLYKVVLCFTTHRRRSPGATHVGGGGDCNSWYNNLGIALADIIYLLLGVLYVIFMFFYR